MKNYVCCTFLSIYLIGFGCTSLRPADFSYVYQRQKDTGLSQLIDINGCYVSQRECDPDFFSIYMFYSDGLFTIATTSDADTLLSCFENGGNSNLCKYPSWGIYTVSGDTIKTQTVFIQGIGTSTTFRDYLILPDKSIQNISDYVNPAKTKLRYKSYPSFHFNECIETARFIPLSKKRSRKDCPYLKYSWFYKP